MNQKDTPQQKSEPRFDQFLGLPALEANIGYCLGKSMTWPQSSVVVGSVTVPKSGRKPNKPQNLGSAMLTSCDEFPF